MSSRRQRSLRRQRVTFKSPEELEQEREAAAAAAAKPVALFPETFAAPVDISERDRTQPETAAAIAAAPRAPSACPTGPRRGEYGAYGAQTRQYVGVGTNVSLQSVWPPVAGKRTFLQAKEGWLGTDNNVNVTSAPLGNQYLFQFQRRGNCGKPYSAELHYGDRVQLQSVHTKRYAQCGAGTCSTVDDAGDCSTGKWQTFTVESVDGKRGRVCFGDRVRITQTVGDKSDLTPGAAGGVFATNNNANAVLTVLPTNGSLYANPDAEMGRAPPPPGPPAPPSADCLGNKAEGEYGAYSAQARRAVGVGAASTFTIEALNWTPATPDKRTMLRWDDGDRFMTDNNVSVSKAPLGAKYQFQLRREGDCGKPSSAPLRYGDRVQLYNAAAGRYAQCGSGTCNLVTAPGTCATSDWQTFTVQSAVGKSGVVCHGDEVRLRQTDGAQAEITAAGGGQVWARNNNRNAVLALLPANGSLYADPARETAARVAAAQKPDDNGDAGDPVGVPTTNDPAATCYGGKTSGEYGAYRAEVRAPLEQNENFTVRFAEWESPAGQRTFMRAAPGPLGGELQTVVGVEPSDAALPSVYQFQAHRVGNCGSGARTQLRYGDRVQLYSAALRQYIRCAGAPQATCSLVDNAETCGADKWETFRIESDEAGKRGALVCMGDKARLVQTSSNKDIVAAGQSQVWADAHGTNPNGIVELLPPNGSLYANPSKELDAEAEGHCERLCKKEPSNLACTFGECSPFADDTMRNIAIGLAVVGALLLIAAIAGGIWFFTSRAKSAQALLGAVAGGGAMPGAGAPAAPVQIVLQQSPGAPPPTVTPPPSPPPPTEP